METSKFFSKVENVFGALFVLALAVLMVGLMAGDIERMQAATTNYDYYSNFIYLIDNIARTYFFCIFMIFQMVYQAVLYIGHINPDLLRYSQSILQKRVWPYRTGVHG